jgi:hypothetical protein
MTAILGMTAILAGCAPACPLAQQQSATETRLYFGADIPGGGQVSDPAWSAFARDVLTPAFPDGFTVYEATGQWQSPGDHKIARERTRVVEIVGPVLPAKVAAVAGSYKRQFRQESVGLVTGQVCASF